MELSQINIAIIEDPKVLLEVALHATKIIAKVNTYTEAYAGRDSFSYTKVELVVVGEESLINFTVSKDITEPIITISPGDWTNAMKALRAYMAASYTSDQHTNLLAELVDGKIVVNMTFDLSETEWSTTIVWLRDVYFPGVKLFATSMRREAVTKAQTLLAV